jgi:hypothetical protein
MRASRWVVGLTSVAAAGTVAFVALPGTARADVPSRYAVSAQGDAMYYEVDSPNIPASPNNTASSLIAGATLSNTDQTAFASTPYYGSTVQNLPGTANGVPPGFGLPPSVSFPFTRLPGYVQARCPTTPDVADDQGYGRVAAKCGEASAEAHGTQGAPASIPAPNQQETADAVTKIAQDGTAVAEASGSASGFVSGPLEVGNSFAKAVISTPANGAPKIDSSTFGRFSVSGQQFGFDKNGFSYLGQETSQKDALASANTALAAAGIQIDIAPVETTKDAVTGQTRYTIGGLRVTRAQQSAGDSPATIVFILGRASVCGVNVAFGAAPVSGTTSLGSAPGATTAVRAPSAAGTTASTGSTGAIGSGTAVAALPAVTGSSASDAASGTALDNALPAASVASATDARPVTTTPADGTAKPRTLGFVPTVSSRNTGGSSEGLYLMLALAAVAVLVMQQAISRFGVRMVAARK